MSVKQLTERIGIGTLRFIYPHTSCKCPCLSLSESQIYYTERCIEVRS